MWRSAVQVCLGLRCKRLQFPTGGLAQLARAPALQAGGLEFESLYLHKSRNSNRCSDFFCGDKTPQPSCDSPGLVTAPVSRWEPDSPAPLGRYARYAHVFFNPQSLRDSPCGALGTGFPRPLGSLRSEWCDYERMISTSPSRPILMIWEARPVAPASRRGSTV